MTTRHTPRPATSHVASQYVVLHDTETPKGETDARSYVEYGSDDDTVVQYLDHLTR